MSDRLKPPPLASPLWTVTRTGTHIEDDPDEPAPRFVRRLVSLSPESEAELAYCARALRVPRSMAVRMAVRELAARLQVAAGG